MMTPKHDSCDLPNTNTVTTDDAGAGLHHASGRRVRSERFKAVRAVMVVFLRHLDPETLCIGHWAPRGDFIPLDIATIAREAGLCRRRCERAIRLLTVRFFEWLGLGPMLARERVRASKALKKRLATYGRSLADVVKRKAVNLFKPLFRPKLIQEPRPKPLDDERLRYWHHLIRVHTDAGLEMNEAQRLVNARMNFPPDWSPGKGAPKGV